MTNRNDTPLIVLSLPWPVSVNKMFRNRTKREGKGRRPKSERYMTWWRAAMNEAMVQRQQPIAGPVELQILLGRPDNRRRDISNLIKGPEDLLVEMGLIEDDSLVQRISVGWCDKTAPKTATVLVWPAEAVGGDRRVA